MGIVEAGASWEGRKGEAPSVLHFVADLAREGW
jgi:hypothetical protein